MCRWPTLSISRREWRRLAMLSEWKLAVTLKAIRRMALLARPERNQRGAHQPRQNSTPAVSMPVASCARPPTRAHLHPTILHLSPPLTYLLHLTPTHPSAALSPHHLRVQAFASRPHRATTKKLTLADIGLLFHSISPHRRAPHSGPRPHRPCLPVHPLPRRTPPPL